jgi:hypothetical protein
MQLRGLYKSIGMAFLNHGISPSFAFDFAVVLPFL